MANLQVKNVSEELHQQLREIASRNRTTISEVVLKAVEHELARRRWLRRLQERSPSELGTTAADLLKEARAERGE